MAYVVLGGFVVAVRHFTEAQRRRRQLSLPIAQYDIIAHKTESKYSHIGFLEHTTDHTTIALHQRSGTGNELRHTHGTLLR